MLDLGGIDVDEIATALADQTDYEHRWLLDPRTGQVAFWTSDTGIDGENPVEIDELDLIPIDPIPSYVWYQDMADFAEGVTDGAAGRRLARALQGQSLAQYIASRDPVSGSVYLLMLGLFAAMPLVLARLHNSRVLSAHERA